MSGSAPPRRGPKFGLDLVMISMALVWQLKPPLGKPVMTPAHIRPSPLQNRVAPDGSLHAAPDRGMLMGNRGGRLHDAHGRLGRARWRSKAWIACRLAFRWRQRAVWGAGYSELFFLDEATALAAGHRPCFECRRQDARAFAAAWADGHSLNAPPRAAEMDQALHAQRRAPRLPVAFGDLPDGAILSRGVGWALKHRGRMWSWSLGGYTRLPDRPEAGMAMTPLTPAAVLSVLEAGYRPSVHPSADLRD